MDCKEEQVQEIDVLKSIYPDEFESIDENSYFIHIKLDTKPPRYIKLGVEYPEEYPQVVPVVHVESSNGLALADQHEESEDEEEINGRAKLAYQVEDFTDRQLNDLTEIVKKAAEENIGMPSIFTLASLLKDSAEEEYAKRLRDKEREYEELITKEEEKEQQKFRGTPVTPESFAVWREKFRKEMNLDEKPVTPVSGKLTGRQIFERNLNTAIDEDDEDVLEEIEQLQLDE